MLENELTARNADDFSLRVATFGDLDAILALQKDVARDLPEVSFATDGFDFYAAVLAGLGRVLLAEPADAAGTLAGASVLRFPHPDEAENLARDAGLPRELHGEARHLEAVYVRREYQGRGLAERLVRTNMEEDDSGRPLSLATVWPLNLPSLKLHLGLGLYVHSFALKYGGRPRFILASGPEQPDWEAEAVLVPLTDDFAEHQKMLTSGYAGTALRNGENGPALEYRPLKH